MNFNISLNDNLLKSPEQFNYSFNSFSFGTNPVVADIDQMSHQLKVRENDQNALRFLWQTTKFENPVDYIITIHLFGKNDSSCLTNYGLKKCIMVQSSNFDAKTVKCVEMDFYMGD